MTPTLYLFLFSHKLFSEENFLLWRVGESRMSDFSGVGQGTEKWFVLSNRVLFPQRRLKIRPNVLTLT